jgi:hypothetical protein
VRSDPGLIPLSRTLQIRESEWDSSMRQTAKNSGFVTQLYDFS